MEVEPSVVVGDNVRLPVHLPVHLPVSFVATVHRLLWWRRYGERGLHWVLLKHHRALQGTQWPVPALRTGHLHLRRG